MKIFPIGASARREYSQEKKAKKRNRGRRATLFCCAAALLMTTFASVAAAAPAGFVTRSGTKFMLDGKPFYVGGTNVHYLGWGSKKEVDAALQDAKAMKFNVVRGILHSVIGSKPGTSKATIWNFWNNTDDSSNMGMHGVSILSWNDGTGKWQWNDSTTDGLGRWDYVISKAKSLGLKLNISLIDYWQWAGGTQQVNAWYGLSDRYYSFYTDARTKQMYKDWVNHVLNRTNSITGVKYKDDPTIFAWDLMNEPEFANDRLGYGRDWLIEMSAYVKSVDPNHLLTTGSEGRIKPDGTKENGFDPEAVLAIPNVDFGTWHSYPVYHGITTADVVKLVKLHGQIAARQNKPVILQEFGYSFRNADQAAVYQSWLDAIFNDPNSAGWVSWRLEGHVVPPGNSNWFPSYEDAALGGYPHDNGGAPDYVGEGFGIHNDGGALAQTMSQAAAKITARNTAVAPTFTSSGTASPNPVARNQATSVTGKFTDTGGALSNCRVDIEIWNGSTRVLQKTWTAQNFAAGQTRSFTFSWTPTSAGTYTIATGVFGNTPDWTPTYLWSANSGSITVK